MSTDLSHSAFELRGGPTWADPLPMYTALRDRDPVHHVVPDNPEHDYWVLSRHADVWAAARDHQTFSSAQGIVEHLSIVMPCQAFWKRTITLGLLICWYTP